MATPTDSVLLKLERAVAHLNDLHGRIDAYCALAPYTASVEKDIEKGRKIIRVIAARNSNAPQPDPHLNVVAGEAIYQLRSTLDHLVYSLVPGGHRSKPEGRTSHQFPIFKDPKGYASHARRLTDGLPDAVARVIENEQPYIRTPHAPETDDLWTLHQLNNTDKHRIIPTTIIGFNAIRVASTRLLVDLSSDDIVLNNEQHIVSSFWYEWSDDEIEADLSASIAFDAARSIGGRTVSLASKIGSITSRVYEIVRACREAATT